MKCWNCHIDFDPFKHKFPYTCPDCLADNISERNIKIEHGQLLTDGATVTWEVAEQGNAQTISVINTADATNAYIGVDNNGTVITSDNPHYIASFDPARRNNDPELNFIGFSQIITPEGEPVNVYEYRPREIPGRFQSQLYREIDEWGQPNPRINPETNT